MFSAQKIKKLGPRKALKKVDSWLQRAGSGFKSLPKCLFCSSPILFAVSNRASKELQITSWMKFTTESKAQKNAQKLAETCLLLVIWPVKAQIFPNTLC
jgi:hypothetical protein